MNMKQRALIYNEDCYNVLDKIDNNSIDLIITDPPYVVYNHGGGSFGSRGYYDEIKDISNGFNINLIDELVLKMKKINMYIFCSKVQLIELINYFNKNWYINYNILCWHKTDPTPTCNNKYLSDTEYILFVREPGVKVFGDYHTKFTWYETSTNRKDKQKYHHPTCKPVEILENFVINSSSEGDMIFDPFIGSGSTAVACLKNNRKIIGCEIYKGYYNICCNRIKRY